jgi:hypothetical protein
MIDIFFKDRLAGAGRLDQVDSGFKHLNVGYSGLRDLDDFHLEDEILGCAESKAPDLRGLKNDNNRHWKLRVNALAEISLVDVCIILTKWKNEKILDHENEHLVDLLISLLQEQAALVVSTYAKQDEQFMLHFFQNCGIHWHNLARQLLFLFQNDEKGYVGEFQKDSPDLSSMYDSRTKVYANLAKFAPNWVNNRGFQTNNEQDIGPYNGPLGCAELEKLWYIIGIVALPLAETY